MVTARYLTVTTGVAVRYLTVTVAALRGHRRGDRETSRGQLRNAYVCPTSGGDHAGIAGVYRGQLWKPSPGRRVGPDSTWGTSEGEKKK